MHTHPESYVVNSSIINLFVRYMDKTGLVFPELQQRLTNLLQQTDVSYSDLETVLCLIEQKRPRIGLALEMALYIEPAADLGTFSYVLQHCSTIPELLGRFHQFQPLLHNLSHSKTVIQDNAIVISWDGIVLHPLIDELFFAALMTVLRALTKNPYLAAAKIELRHPEPSPKYIALYENFFGGAVLFNQPCNQLRLDSSIMDTPLNHADAFLKNLILHHAESLLKKNESRDVLIHQIQACIVTMLEQNIAPTLKTIADNLQQAEHALSRTLKNKGTTYQAILDSTRYALARDYLLNHRLSMIQIAHALGYAEASSFTRAFTSWAGVAPLHYRKNQHKPSE